MLILDFNGPIVYFMVAVTGIGSLIHLYSISYMHDDENMHVFRVFEPVYILHDYISNGSNLLVLFIGWEGVGLVRILLFWHKTKSTMTLLRKRSS
jgi:NADH-quinone oxidoreductase subunit L